MEFPTDPAAPCPCPSGLPYGECHKPIIEAADAELLDVVHREYVRRWEGNASAYEVQGIYRWLAERLARFGPVRRVIDVGCGRGEGMAALREITGDEGLLVGIDENPDCLGPPRIVFASPSRRDALPACRCQGGRSTSGRFRRFFPRRRQSSLSRRICSSPIRNSKDGS